MGKLKAFITGYVYRYWKHPKWVQPNLTSNTSYGTVSCSSYYSSDSINRAPYKGVNGSYANVDNDRWGTNNTAVGWWNWSLPIYIRIKGIQVRQTNHATRADNHTVDGMFFTASDLKTPIGNRFDLTRNQLFTVQNIPVKGIVTNNLYFKKLGETYSGFAQLYIDADDMTKWVECTENDDYEWVQKIPIYSCRYGAINGN